MVWAILGILFAFVGVPMLYGAVLGCFDQEDVTDHGNYPEPSETEWE